MIVLLIRGPKGLHMVDSGVRGLSNELLSHVDLYFIGLYETVDKQCVELEEQHAKILHGLSVLLQQQS